MTYDLEGTALLALSLYVIFYVYAESVAKLGVKKGLPFVTIMIVSIGIPMGTYYKTVEQPRIMASVERTFLNTFAEAKVRYLSDGNPWPQSEAERREAIRPYLSLAGQPYPASEFDLLGERIRKHPCALALNDVGCFPQYLDKK